MILLLAGYPSKEKEEIKEYINQHVKCENILNFNEVKKQVEATISGKTQEEIDLLTYNYMIQNMGDGTRSVIVNGAFDKLDYMNFSKVQEKNMLILYVFTKDEPYEFTKASEKVEKPLYIIDGNNDSRFQQLTRILETHNLKKNE